MPRSWTKVLPKEADPRPILNHTKRRSWFTRSYRYLAIIVAKLPNRAECPTIHAAASSTFPSNHLCVMKTISPPFRGDLGVTIGSTILHKRIRCISLELKILQGKAVYNPTFGPILLEALCRGSVFSTARAYDRQPEPCNRWCPADVVRTGACRVKRVIYPPGFRWATHMKAIVGTDLCMHAHVGFLVRGQIHIQYADGCTLEFAAPQAIAIEPGHDGWVVGDEAAVLIEFDFEGDTVGRLGMPDSHRHG